jgi:putative oxidoreductase
MRAYPARLASHAIPQRRRGRARAQWTARAIKGEIMQRTHDAILLLGRLLVATMFLPSGITKLSNFDGFTTSLADKGLPHAELWAVAAVAIEMLAPIALMIGVFPRLTALALIAFVIAATATSHRYWELQEPLRRAQQINFFKNVGVSGGLLFYFVSGPGRWSLNRQARKADSRVAQATP